MFSYKKNRFFLLIFLIIDILKKKKTQKIKFIDIFLTFQK